MSLRDMLEQKKKAEEAEKSAADKSEEKSSQSVEVEVSTELEELEELEETTDPNADTVQPQSEKPEEVSAEEKLRAKKNRALFEDEVKTGEWDEYQEELKALKNYAEARKMDWTKMVAGVNAQFKKATSATVTYERKVKEVSAQEKPFYDAKLVFDNAIIDLTNKFQGTIDTLCKKYNYPGKRPEIDRTAYIKHGKEFKDFLSKLE